MRDFLTLYIHHLQLLEIEFPSVKTRLFEHKYPSDVEYQVLLGEMKDHAAFLDSVSNNIWDSGHYKENIGEETS